MSHIESQPGVSIRENLSLIDEAIQGVVRRRMLDHDEGEEFASIAKLKLLEREDKIMGDFKGLCSLKTYLSQVIDRILLDWRIAKWGKWRPSKAAKQGGDRTMAVERLLYRERYSLAEAVQILKVNLQWSLTTTEISDMATQLPQRHKRRTVPLEDNVQLASPSKSADDLPLKSERSDRRSEVKRLLLQAYSLLPPEERTLLRLRFKEGLTIAEIARKLACNQRRLYRSFNAILRRLRGYLESKGLHRSELALLIGSSGEVSAHLFTQELPEASVSEP